MGPTGPNSVPRLLALFSGLTRVINFAPVFFQT
jgi:hypothetical protein